MRIEDVVILVVALVLGWIARKIYEKRHAGSGKSDDL